MSLWQKIKEWFTGKKYVEDDIPLPPEEVEEAEVVEDEDSSLGTIEKSGEEEKHEQ